MKHLIIALLTLNSSGVFAQTDSTKSLVALELDPAPFILKGYSFSLKYSPKKTRKLAIMASIFSSDFPDGMMIKVNKDKGFTNLKLEPSYALFVEYYLNNQRKGFFFGPSIFLYNKSVSYIPTNERISFSTIYPNFRVGYTWYPFRKINLYIAPWLNIGSEINIDKENNVNNSEFTPNKFSYVVAIHLGYSLKF